MSRIAARFAEMKKEGRAAFVPFITAGDPAADVTAHLLEGLPAAGADIIELGVPFSDPMADGPAIQASSMRALKGGMTVPGVLALVKRFRTKDDRTPLVLMGYYNPIHAYGVERFVADAGKSGVDGLIVVDCGPEEDATLRAAAVRASVDIVRLAAPTTDDARLRSVLNGAGGFLYYVSIAGVTGTKTFMEAEVKRAVQRIHAASTLPCAVGFGIRTPDQAAAIARFADAAVVGSAIVARIADDVSAGKPAFDIVRDTLNFCSSLAKAVHTARAERI